MFSLDRLYTLDKDFGASPLLCSVQGIGLSGVVELERGVSGRLKVQKISFQKKFVLKFRTKVPKILSP